MLFLPVELLAIGGSLGAWFLGRHMYWAYEWPLWSCILVGLGVIGITALLTHKYGTTPPTV